MAYSTLDILLIVMSCKRVYFPMDTMLKSVLFLAVSFKNTQALILDFLKQRRASDNFPLILYIMVHHECFPFRKIQNLATHVMIRK